ncbi:unnamed protein product [Pylaiella littoralis]
MSAGSPSGTRMLTAAAAHVCLLVATCCSCYHHASSHAAGAFIYNTQVAKFRRQQHRGLVPATGNTPGASTFPSLTRIRRTTTTLRLQQQQQQHQQQHQQQQQQHHHLWRESSRYPHVLLRALPEDSTSPPASASEATETDEVGASATGGEEKVPPARGRSRADTGGSGTSSGSGPENQFIGKLTRRMADSFPMLTADEIKSEVRALLNPEAKAEANKANDAREDNLALLAKDVRELVEDLMERVGSNTDTKAGLVELKSAAQKFQGVLRGDPAAVEEIRRQVMDDLEEVREEIEELLEVKELTKARERLEKATTESTEKVFDSAVTAMLTGLDKAVNEGKDAIPEGEETERFQISTFVYGENNEFWDDMRANGVTRQRFFTYSLLGLAVAVGGNLFGLTSGLLSIVAPGASRDLRVDLLFPVGGFKRFYSPEDGYEFMYPETWVGDSGLALRRQRDLEDMRTSPAAVAKARQRRSSSAPEVAFGPQGGDGIENVSVVKSELMPGFSLKKTLGEPKEAAEKLLSTVIAPPDSGREWELLDAFEDGREPGGSVYQFEYRVQGQGIRKPMRNVGVVAARGSTLFTVTVLAPEESWRGDRGEQFRQMAKSFRLTF